MKLTLLPWTLLLALPLHAAQDDREPDLVRSGSDGAANGEEPAIEALPTVLAGRVLLPGGEPAAGAVVVTAAGGRAVTDASGEFALEVDLAAEVAEVRVTAAHTNRGASLVASCPVLLPFAGGAHPTGTLVLSQGSACEPSWLPTFGALDGVSGDVFALAVFDAGAGPELYVGGDFTSAGGGTPASRIARWNGTVWSALGSGLNDSVRALAAHDDGTGPALYAAGYFGIAGGVSALRVARWDGTSWSPLGSGIDGWVHALAVHDDGTGPALYAAGGFSAAGGLNASHIARWDGSGWTALGEGLDSVAHALTTYDDGTGPALYVGGQFFTAGGAGASRIARWDGTIWSPLGSGMDDQVHALTVHDDGTGPALYAGGWFTTAGATSASAVARWDGTSWSAVGFLQNGSAGEALAVYDDGAGPALYAAGWLRTSGSSSAQRILRWNGSSWSTLGSGGASASPILALTVHDDGAGPALYAGGFFTTAEGSIARRIARWNGASWSALESGLDGTARAVTVYDDGAGPALYAGGDFTKAAGASARRLVKWDGASWSALESGLDAEVHALNVYDDGTGSALYAGGDFTAAGGVNVSHIAKWDGTSWSPLGSGVNGSVRALTVYDDGTGPALYAGGSFTMAGGVSASRIAKWDGTSWSALGSGLGNLSVWVFALTMHDDGTGPALYAGGTFSTAGGASASRVAKWDGTSWSALGSGPGSTVWALQGYDDGTGPALYAGGLFNAVGGTIANRIARWDGTTWSALGSGLNSTVNALTVYDDGAGPALYVGGLFTTAGGASANRIARWDGTTWSALGSGLGSSVLALTVYDDGTGESLVAAGSFTVSPAGDWYLARWGGCTAAVGVAYCFGDQGTCPCANHGAPGEGCAGSTGSGAVLSAEGSSVVANDDLAFAGSGLVPGTPGLLFVGNSAVNGGAGVPFGDGLRCAVGGVRRLGVRTADAFGNAGWGPALSGAGGWTSGDTRRFQIWYRDSLGPCGNGFNLSNGYELTFTN